MEVSGSYFRGGEQVALSGGTARVVLTTRKNGRFGPVGLTIPATAVAGIRQVTAAATSNAKGQSAAAWFTVQTEWTQTGFGSDLNADNTAEHNLTPGNVKDLTSRWTAAGGGSQESSAAVVDDGVAYFASGDYLDAVDASTGASRWEWSDGDGVVGFAAVDGIAYVIDGDDSVVAIGSDGVTLWTYVPEPTGNSFETAPTVTGNVVYAVDTGGTVYAINAATGLLIWISSAVTQECGQPAVTGGVLYLACRNGSVYALNATSGAFLWTASTGTDSLAALSVSGGVIYATSWADDYLYAISVSTHKVMWTFTAGGTTQVTPVAADGLVYVSSWDGYLYAVNAQTGAKVWSHAIQNELPYPFAPVVAGKVVYEVNGNERLYALNALTGAQLWSYRSGNTLQSAPTVVNGMVYVGTGSGGLAGFGLRS